MRELTGKSQTEFGALFNLSRGKINSYEGNSEPRILKLIEIAHYFCISVETMVLVDLRAKKFKLKPNTAQWASEPKSDYVVLNEGGLEDIADFVTEHHTELLKNKTYRFWFEKEVFEKSLDVVKEKMGK